MTHKEAVLEKFREDAREILVNYSPWVLIGPTYSLDLSKYGSYREKLGDRVMEINAPDLTYEEKRSISIWAKEELDKYMERVLKVKLP